MQIKQRLEYPIWKTPYFCVLGLFVFFKLVRAGTLTLLIDKPFFNKKLNEYKNFGGTIFDGPRVLVSSPSRGKPRRLPRASGRPRRQMLWSGSWRSGTPRGPLTQLATSSSAAAALVLSLGVVSVLLLLTGLC